MFEICGPKKQSRKWTRNRALQEEIIRKRLVKGRKAAPKVRPRNSAVKRPRSNAASARRQEAFRQVSCESAFQQGVPKAMTREIKYARSVEEKPHGGEQARGLRCLMEAFLCPVIFSKPDFSRSLRTLVFYTTCGPFFCEFKKAKCVKTSILKRLRTPR